MIWLAQLFCPERHAIIAVVYDGDEMEEATRNAELAFKSGVLNRRCGICGSTNLTWKSRATAWRTIEEAMPAIRQCQEDQMATRALLDIAGLTVDSRKNQEN